MKRLTLLALLFVAGCDAFTLPRSLDSSELELVDRGRSRLDTADIAPLRALAQLALPDSVAAFGLTSPVWVAADPSSCTFVIGDRDDRAVHEFSATGVYRRTLTGGTRSASLMPWLNAVSVSPQSTIVASDMGKGNIVLLANDGQHRLLKPRELMPRQPVGAQIVAGSTQLFQNWLYQPIATYSKHWGSELPLVRVYSRSGQELARIGTVETHSGALFTAEMNRGIIALAGDTLWYARRADGRLLGFSTLSATRQPQRVIELPVFYEMRSPKELFSARRNVSETSVESHVVAFSIGAYREFLVGQARSYPHNRRAVFRPTTVLTVYGRTGEHLGSFDLEGAEILSLAATPNTLAAVLLDRAQKRRVVRLYRHPLAARGTPNENLKSCDTKGP